MNPSYGGGLSMRKTFILLPACLVLVSLGARPHDDEKVCRFKSPEIVSTQEAVYPATAIGPGTVVFAVTIGPSGEVKGVKTLQGAGGFVESAKAALKGWKFKPATLDGQPITAVLPIAFSFSRPTVWWPTRK